MKIVKVSLVIVTIKILSFAVILMMSSVVCAAEKVSISEQIEFEDILDLTQPRYITAIPNEKYPWVLFVTKDRKILAKSLDKRKSVEINQGHKGSSSGLAYLMQKNFLHVIWREKTIKKELFFRSVEFPSLTIGQPVMIDTDTEPLTRLFMGGTEKGDITVVWYGEKSSKDNKKRYAIYSANSLDFGKTFSPAIDLTPQSQFSIWPNLFVDEHGNYFVFAEVVRDGKREMVVRKKSDGGWEEPVSLGPIGTVGMGFIRTAKLGNRIMVFWFNSYDDGSLVTEMACSDDGGKSWNRQVIESTRNIDITSMNVKTDNISNVYLFLSGVRKMGNSEVDKNAKDNVYLVFSKDKGTSFTQMISLRHYPYNLTKAQFPSAVVDGKRIVVVWNDYRNIRANIYMNYSEDGGDSWQSKDIALEEPGRFNTVLYMHSNNLLYHNGLYYVLAHRFENDAMETPHPVVIPFKIK